jgi:hypothetical protein
MLIPPKTAGKNVKQLAPGMRKYHALDKDGLACIGEELRAGDIFVNKYKPEITDGPVLRDKEIDNLNLDPCTSSFKGNLPINVDRVILTSTPELHLLIKMISR